MQFSVYIQTVIQGNMNLMKNMLLQFLFLF